MSTRLRFGRVGLGQAGRLPAPHAEQELAEEGIDEQPRAAGWSA